MVIYHTLSLVLCFEFRNFRFLTAVSFSCSAEEAWSVAGLMMISVDDGEHRGVVSSEFVSSASFLRSSSLSGLIYSMVSVHEWQLKCRVYRSFEK